MANEIKIQSDGSVYVKIGTQMSCSGIARVHLKIEPTSGNSLEFLTGSKSDWTGDGEIVPGEHVPSYLREAVFNGVQEAYQSKDLKSGFKIILIDAFVHEVDSTEAKYKAAGRLGFNKWVEFQDN